MIEDITLLNMITNTELHIDKDTTQDYVLGDVDLGTVGSTHKTYKYIDEIGESLTNTILSTRIITIEGWVIGTKLEITSRKKILNSFFNPQQQVRLRYSDYNLYFFPNTTIKYGTTEETNNYAMAKFQVEGFCADPLFHNKNDSIQNIAYTVGMFHFPLLFNAESDPPTVVFGYRPDSMFTNVLNEGDVEAGIKIVMSVDDDATSGSTVVNPVVVNAETQEYFKINKTIAMGETVTIDTNVGNRTVTGTINGIDYNYFRYKDLASTWLQLKQGNNVLRYDADSGINNLIIDVYFNSKYLEVQECL